MRSSDLECAHSDFKLEQHQHQNRAKAATKAEQLLHNLVQHLRLAMQFWSHQTLFLLSEYSSPSKKWHKASTVLKNLTIKKEEINSAAIFSLYFRMRGSLLNLNPDFNLFLLLHILSTEHVTVT